VSSKATSRGWLLALTGPLVWSTHFLLVYAGQGFICAGSDSLAALLVGAASIVALAALAALLIAQRRTPSSPRAIALPLTALSSLGVAWVSLPALIVPACL